MFVSRELIEFNNQTPRKSMHDDHFSSERTLRRGIVSDDPRQRRAAECAFFKEYSAKTASFIHSHWIKDFEIALELTQDVMIEVWRWIVKYPDSTATISSKVFLTARCRSIDRLRKMQREPKIMWVEDLDKINQGLEDSVEAQIWDLATMEMRLEIDRTFVQVIKAAAPVQQMVAKAMFLNFRKVGEHGTDTEIQKTVKNEFAETLPLPSVRRARQEVFKKLRKALGGNFDRPY